MDESGGAPPAGAGDDEVVLGPDLDPSRSKMDRKLYRHVTLANGLRCVLICDTVAMRQRRLLGRRCDGSAGDDDASEGESESDGDETGDDEDEGGDDASGDGASDDEDEEDDGLRKAAAALLVNVGSYHDPPRLQGLSHFLEHMLFLGTESFPEENAYDAFLSKLGGDDNAYTDMEHTLFHFCVPQDGGDGDGSVWRALEMFAAFFKCPLLGGEMAGRELNAVESEFGLSRKDDECRLGQVQSFTCGMDGRAPIMGRYARDGGDGEGGKPFHPFAKVSVRFGMTARDDCEG